MPFLRRNTSKSSAPRLLMTLERLFVRSVLQGLVRFAHTSSRRSLPPRGATASGLGRRRNALEEMRTLRCQLRAGKDFFWDLPVKPAG